MEEVGYLLDVQKGNQPLFIESDKRGASLPLTLLRTVLEPFNSYGSSLLFVQTTFNLTQGICTSLVASPVRTSKFRTVTFSPFCRGCLHNEQRYPCFLASLILSRVFSVSKTLRSRFSQCYLALRMDSVTPIGFICFTIYNTKFFFHSVKCYIC